MPQFGQDNVFIQTTFPIEMQMVLFDKQSKSHKLIMTRGSKPLC